MKQVSIVVCIISMYFAIVHAGFHIPFFGGGIDIDKTPDGKTQVNVGQNVDILGFGGNRNLTFVAGNGTFSTQTDQNLLLNGTKVGGGSNIGVDKNNGITLDNNLNLGNKTIEGGVGKEGNFITQLVETIEEAAAKNKAKNGRS